ncbi:MAG: hypothetical protein ABR514_10305 [Chthoniobacterales bacterium]
MKPKLLFMTLIAMSALTCIVSSEPPAVREDSRLASKRNIDAVIEALRPIFYSSDKAFRLYYRAECHPTKDIGVDEPIPFPFTKVQPPSNSTTGLAAVREVFKNDKNVTVTEGTDGIIRITIGKVPTAILQTKLPLLNLDATAQYNPQDAFSAIVNTNEMEAAMRLFRFSSIGSLSSTRAEPGEGFPHLPSSMSNVSVEQALDEIAKTWAGEGIVIYGVCAELTEPGGRQRFALDYAGDVVPK